MHCPLNLHPSALIQATCLSWMDPSCFPLWFMLFSKPNPSEDLLPEFAERVGAYQGPHAAWRRIIIKKKDRSLVTWLWRPIGAPGSFHSSQDAHSPSLRAPRSGCCCRRAPPPPSTHECALTMTPALFAARHTLYRRVSTVSQGNAAAAVTLMYSKPTHLRKGAVHVEDKRLH